MSHWLYKGQIFNEVPDGAFGFIYRITNNVTGKKYIGRKYFYTTRRIKVAGKTRRTVKTVESKWQTYTGSSKLLTEDIKTVGKDKFTFEILAIGYTKGQVNYLEDNLQHKLNVLTDDQYYNDSIGARGYIGVKIDDQFKKAVQTITL